MEQILSLVLVYTVFLGALMSPGPDLLIVLRNALGYSARAGVFTALGIALAISIHLAYCIAGIGLLISQSIILFNLVKWIGAGYLIYVGVQALRSKGTALNKGDITKNISLHEKSDWRSFVNGFITNLFNPKATLFFLALFSQMIDPQMAVGLQIVLGISFMVTAFLWFSMVSVVMGIKRIRQGYARVSIWIDRIFGAFFIALGVKLAVSKI